MNTFIIPVDFSAVSATALQYGYHLAIQTQAQEVIVCHIYLTPLTENVANIQQIDALAASAQSEKERRLKEFVQQSLGHLTAAKLPPITYMADEGDLINQLQQITNNSTLIVMGTMAQPKPNTASGFSQTTDVMLQTTTPVMVIPAGAVYRKPQNIVYAIDYEQFDRKTLYSLKAFSDRVDAKVTLLHINAQPGITNHTQLVNYRKTIQDIIPYENIKLDFIEGDDVANLLLHYTQQHDTNILALLTKKGQLSNPDYVNSLSSQLLMQCPIPIIVFHPNAF
ncbi:MAG TPA: universal stress protein [Chitinophagales bacterium]|nr:universal stress protein [Chitinophagales bacterium]HRK27559.1 universal stress protein [Chitinophagales bacterium]